MREKRLGSLRSLYFRLHPSGSIVNMEKHHSVNHTVESKKSGGHHDDVIQLSSSQVQEIQYKSVLTLNHVHVKEIIEHDTIAQFATLYSPSKISLQG